MNDRRHQVLVEVQQALLGEISAQVRAVIVSYGDTSIHLDFYYDGAITEEDRESASCVETELIAVFPESHIVTSSTHRRDYPEPIPKEMTWVFSRKEDCE